MLPAGQDGAMFYPFEGFRKSSTSDGERPAGGGGWDSTSVPGVTKLRPGPPKHGRGGPFWAGRWLGVDRFLAVRDRFMIAKTRHCTAWPAMARFGSGLGVAAGWSATG